MLKKLRRCRLIQHSSFFFSQKVVLRLLEVVFPFENLPSGICHIHTHIAQVHTSPACAQWGLSFAFTHRIASSCTFFTYTHHTHTQQTCKRLPTYRTTIRTHLQTPHHIPTFSLDPIELQHAVLSNLSLSDLIHFAYTCKRWYEIITTDNALWKVKCVVFIILLLIYY